MDEGLGAGYITIAGGDLGQNLDTDVVISPHSADEGYIYTI
jgi:hypothetical protein